MREVTKTIEQQMNKIIEHNNKAPSYKILNELLVKSPLIGMSVSEAINKAVSNLQKKEKSTSPEMSPQKNSNKNRLRFLSTSPSDDDDEKLDLPTQSATPKTSKTQPPKKKKKYQEVNYTPVASRIKKNPRTAAVKN